MANFAEPSDVAAWWRDLSPEEEARATALLTSASALIRDRVPTVDDRITAGTLDPEIPKIVAIGATLRILQNPNGVRSWSIDDVTVTYDRSDTAGPLEMHLTDHELDLLTGRRRGRIRTARITPTLHP